MTNEEYHNDTTRISKSGLDLIARSPAHYYAKYLDPNRERPKKEKSWATVGTLLHAMLLEPEIFSQRYKVLPADAPKRPTSAQLNAVKPSADTLKAIQFYRDLDAQSPGVEIISIDMYDAACRMRDSVLANTAAANLLSRGKAEQTILFNEESTGAPCKCRPDWLTDYQFVVDIKTTEDASAEAFGRSAVNYRYHVQAPFYIDGVNTALGYNRVEFFAFICVEKESPYATAIYVISPDDMQIGRDEYLRNLHAYTECMRTGNWPGYPSGMHALKLPAWFTRQYQQI